MSTELQGIMVSFGGDVTGLTNAVTKGSTSLALLGQGANESASRLNEAFSSITDRLSTLGNSFATSNDGFLRQSQAVSADGESFMSLFDVLAELDSLLSDQQVVVSSDGEALVSLGSVMADLAAFADESAAALTAASEAQDQAASTAAYLASTEGGLAPAFTKAADAADMQSGALRRASEGTKGFSLDLGGMVTKIGLGIFSLQSLWSMASQGVSALLGPAMSAETMQSAFTNLLGSTKAATAELQKLDTFASHTPFTTLDIDKAAASLVGFGFKAKELVPDMTAIGDALSAVGKGTPAEMQSVVDIFGKIRTQGKLTLADINQLGSHGINALQLIAQGAGLSTDAVRKMISNGTLPANQAINDLTKGIEKNPLYQGGMAKQSATMTGILSTLKSNFDQMLASFASPILKAVEPLFTNLANSLSSPAFKQFASSVGTGLINVFTSIGKALGGINMGSFASTFGTAFSGIQKALSGINIGNVITTLGTLAKTVGGILANAFTTLGPILAQVFKWFSNDLMPALNKALPPIGNLINSIVDLVGAALGPLLAAIEPLIPPILQIAGNVANVLAPAFKFLAPIIQTALAPALHALFMPLQVLFNLLAGNWKGALDAIGLGFLATADKAKIAAIQTQEAQVKTALVKDTLQIQGNAKELAAMETQRQALLKKLKETHDPLEKAEITHQLNMLDAKEKGVKDQLDAAEKDKQQQLAKQKELHDQMLEAQKSGLQRLLDSWGQGLGSMFSGLGTFVHNVIGKVGDFFSQLGTKVHDGIGKVGDVFSQLGSGLHGIWDGIANTVRGGINNIIDAINGFINGVDAIHMNIPGVGNIGFSIPDIPHLALGGTILPGHVGLVGETGKPEIISGGTQGVSVLGARDTATLLGSGLMAESAPVVHVTVENHTHNYIDGHEMLGVLGPQIIHSVLAQGPVKSW